MRMAPPRAGARQTRAWRKTILRGVGIAATASTAVGLAATAIAQTPAPASIVGRIRLAGRGVHAGTGVQADGLAVAETSPDGAFAIPSLTPGQHVIRADRPRYLCAETTVDVETGRTTRLPDLVLPGGDTDSNGKVDLFDLVRVGARYRQSPPGDPRADLNDDGTVDLFDLVMVSASYDTACPVPWPASPPRPSSTPTAGVTPAASVTPGVPPPGGRAVVVDTADIVVGDGGVDGHTVYAPVGATITWHNRLDRELQLIGATDALSVAVRAGGHATWRVPAAGIFPYHADGDPVIEGAIVALAEPGVAARYFRGSTIADFYRDSCGGCHGANREGALGPALVPERLTSRDPEYIRAIGDGRPNTAMPAWRSIGLSDAEIWGLLGYLRSPVAGGAATWDIDAIQRSRMVFAEESTLPDRPTHAGDPANLMLVTERDNRTIAVIDGASHQLIGRIESGYQAHGYAFPPTSDRWVFNVSRDGWVYKLDLYSLRAVRIARVGLDARGIAVSDDGRYLVVGNYVPATAVVLDAATLEPLLVLPTRGQDPDGRLVDSRVALVADVAASSVGPYFLLVLKEAGQVWRLDWSQPGFPATKLANVGRVLHDGFLGPDNRRLYVASQADDWIAVVDVARLTIVDRIPTGDIPHPGPGAVWSAGGRDFAATVHAGEGLITIWDLASNAVVGRRQTPGPGLFIRAAANSPFVWADAMLASAPHAITVMRKSPPFDVVGTLTEGRRTLHPELTADGRYAYVADWDGGAVRVYDATTLALVAEITGLTTPTGIFSTGRRLETGGH